MVAENTLRTCKKKYNTTNVAKTLTRSKYKLATSIRIEIIVIPSNISTMVRSTEEICAPATLPARKIGEPGCPKQKLHIYLKTFW